MDKKGFGKTSWEGKSQNSYAKGGKRKFSQSPADSPKKPKGGRGPLTSEDFERAKKERLCFHCLGTHEKKDCPQLKHKDAEKGKGKEKALHMVQVLPLEDSPKFFVVHVSHTETSHECCLTASMWQQTFGPHELFCMHGTINGQRVCILVDDGSNS